MVSDRQGRRFHFLQTLTIVTCDRPSSAASDRLDQCVTPSPTGGDLQRPDDDLGLVDDCGRAWGGRPDLPSPRWRTDASKRSPSAWTPTRHTISALEYPSAARITIRCPLRQA